MGKRQVKEGEIKNIFEDLNTLCGWSSSNYLPTGDFHETGFTKRTEKK